VTGSAVERRPPGGPPRRARVRVIAATLAICALAASCTASPETTRRDAGGPKGTIVVGVSGAFTENQLVAEMYAQVLEHAGYTVERQFDLRSREVSQFALESGQIDLKPEYLSSLLLYVDRGAVPLKGRAAVAAEVADVLGPRGISVLTPSPAQDTNQFVANAQTASRYGLRTMSSLARVADRLTLGAPPECPQRPFCLTGLKETYGILFDDFEPLDVGGPQTIEALATDQVQIALLFSTDPSIRANGFVPLVDDRHLQDAENITPVIRSAVLTDGIRDALDGVSARLTSAIVTQLVGRVVLGGEDVPTAAREFLTANRLL
jgi:osmoprotectant transport system substrate-binding protein